MHGRDALIIPQNLPIILLRISPEPSRLFIKTKPIILNKNSKLCSAENHFAERNEQMVIIPKRNQEIITGDQ